jgi:methylated-DNA-[protein]-cysteine S-methyltransferase
MMDTATGHAPGQGTPRLVKEAADPDVDPCDLACQAMPAHVVGDLCAQDEHWLHEHTEECGYCRNELRRYDTLDNALDACGEICCQDVKEPPPVTLPRRDRVWYTRVASPVGDLILAVTREGLREIDFGKEVSDLDFMTRMRQTGAEAVRVERIEDADPEARQTLQRASTELQEYFGGKRNQFDIPLDWGAMPPFRRAVLEATAAVPFGHVDTYAGIAKRIGNPKATRAVGNALGRNPIPVIVPCHRVIRSDASLGGYTGGLGIKQHLLNHEGVRLA